MKALKYFNPLKMNFINFLLALSAAAAVTLSNGFIQNASAEPQMKTRELPLEGTHIYSLKVNKKGYGNIELSCRRCKNNRIWLNVTPASYVMFGGVAIRMSQYKPTNKDFMTGFYKPDTKELTWLQVERLK